MSQNKLYIGNLPYSISEDEVKQAFAQFGEVKDIALIKDRETGRPKGFGFVTMDSDESAKNSLEMDGKDLNGRAVRVNIAKDNREGGGRDNRRSRSDNNSDRERS